MVSSSSSPLDVFSAVASRRASTCSSNGGLDALAVAAKMEGGGAADIHELDETEDEDDEDQEEEGDDEDEDDEEDEEDEEEENDDENDDDDMDEDEDDEEEEEEEKGEDVDYAGLMSPERPLAGAFVAAPMATAMEC